MVPDPNITWQQTMGTRILAVAVAYPSPQTMNSDTKIRGNSYVSDWKGEHTPIERLTRQSSIIDHF
jgi:hypothetical protein